MHKKKRFLFTILPIFSLLIILSACGQQELEDPLGWEVNAFEYTTQSNEQLSLADMEGEVWLADFIFTSCNTVCPPMTRNMAKLQKQLEEEGLDVKIVSFSVDPEVDTPEKLQSFAEKHGADLSNWSFLTGYEMEDIKTFAEDSFKTPVSKPEGEDQVTHGTSFYLIDQNGVVQKRYNGNKDVPYEQIVEGAKITANQ
ncbi:SCO family protein [Thalassobacillus sp. CUG 92003]|uniref:SCO family protein n=1 Tax=Thalassobacillus sp. CUG 92003 TaxID=2736641 RepID=UPI0015E66F61|nr:SCO family protein [Thalassobacillus sp. CUG 92003]